MITLKKRRFINPHTYDGGGFAGLGNIVSDTVMPGFISAMQEYNAPVSDNAKKLGDEYVELRRDYNKNPLGILGFRMANNINSDINRIEDETANVLKGLNTSYSTRSMDDALNNYNNLLSKKNYYNNYDFNMPKNFNRFMKSTLTGTSIGTQITPGWGTLIGTAAGAAEYLLNSPFNNKILDSADIFGRKAIRNKYNLALASSLNNINNINMWSNINKSTNYGAYGGPINVGLLPVNGTIDYMQNNDIIDSMNNSKQNTRYNFPSFALGGNLMSNGGDWENGLTYIGSGGTHEENPIGGVIVGMSQDGKPDMVEQGEYVWDYDGDQKYVFSDRLILPDEAYNMFGLSKSKKGMTFAKVASYLEKESSERPNDPISKKGLNDFLYKLMMVQEKVREIEAQKQQIDNQKKELKNMKYALGGFKGKKGGNRGNGKSKGGGAGGRYGDIDYIENILVPPTYRNFNDFFSDAKSKGLDTAYFNGKPYLIKVDPNYKGNGKKEVEMMSPIGNLRKVYTKNGVELQDSTRFEPGIVKPIGFTEREVIDGKESLKYIGGEPDWSNKALGGHLFPYGGDKIEFDPSIWNWIPKDDILQKYPQFVDVSNIKIKEPPQIKLPIKDKPSLSIKIDGIDENGNIDWKAIKRKVPLVTGRKNNKSSDDLPTSGWQTKLTSIPILTSGLSALYNWYNKPDYEYPEEYKRVSESALNKIPYAKPKFLGHNYIQYTPFDRLNYANELSANVARNNRNIINIGNGDYGKTMNGLFASNYNDNIDFGKLYRQGEEYNLNQRLKIAELNKAIDQYNSTADLQAQTANINRDADVAKRLIESEGNYLKLKQAIDDNYSSNLSNSLTSLSDNIAGLGEQYRDMYLINALIKSGAFEYLNDAMKDYFSNVNVFHGACGGKLHTKKRKRSLTI